MDFKPNLLIHADVDGAGRADVGHGADVGDQVDGAHQLEVGDQGHIVDFRDPRRYRRDTSSSGDIYEIKMIKNDNTQQQQRQQDPTIRMGDTSTGGDHPEFVWDQIIPEPLCDPKTHGSSPGGAGKPEDEMGS